jgi:putative selenium metabolism protein SsnA
MLITNANVITWGEPNQILENHSIFIEKDLIKEIGPQAEMEKLYPNAERLDAHSQFVMPGNICAHTHFYGAFARGMAIPGPAPKDFPEILGKLWWPLDKALTEEDIHYSALVCLVDALKHGTTSLVDHHASPNTIPGSLDILAQAVDESGLRSVLCYEVTDRDGEAKARAGIAENVRFIERTRRVPIAGGRVAANFGLHASLTLSDKTLDLCRDALPEQAGFHIHAAESDVDEYDSLTKSGLRVVDRLEKHNILGDHTILAHAVHVDAREIALLAQNGVWVSHQPRSNMNNGVGVAPVESMLRAGVKVCLGNDGLSNTMWKEWEAAYLLPKIWNHDPRCMSAVQVAQMAVTHNSHLMRIFFPEAPLGVIQPGAYADLIFVDYHPTTPIHTGNLPWHIIFGFNESMVTTTLVAGRILVRDRQLLTLVAA